MSKRGMKGDGRHYNEIVKLMSNLFAGTITIPDPADITSPARCMSTNTRYSI